MDSANIPEATRAALVAAAVVSRRNLVPRSEIARALAESLRDPARSFLDRLPEGALSEADRSAVDSEFSAGLSSAAAQGSAVTSWLGELVGLVSEVEDPALRSTLESALRPLAEESDAGTFAGPVPERDLGTIIQNLSDGAEQGTLSDHRSTSSPHAPGKPGARRAYQPRGLPSLRKSKVAFASSGRSRKVGSGRSLLLRTWSCIGKWL